MAFDVPPQAFTPAPKVTSSIVHLDVLAEPRFPADANRLQAIVAAAFGQRRKMLRASLKSVAPDITERLTALGIDPTARAETLDLEAFCKLAREL